MHAPLLTEIFDECLSSLKRIHAAGYCHTDLRRPNILKFGDRYELIDFGDAVKIVHLLTLINFQKEEKISPCRKQ